jgi:hypothetical protein
MCGKVTGACVRVLADHFSGLGGEKVTREKMPCKSGDARVSAAFFYIVEAMFFTPGVTQAG